MLTQDGKLMEQSTSTQTAGFVASSSPPFEWDLRISFGLEMRESAGYET
jgi:hypothetical protein